MAKFVNLVIVFAVISTAMTITIHKQSPYIVVKDHLIDNVHYMSKPGTAIFSDWKKNKPPLFAGGDDSDWRGELGMQLVKKVYAGDIMVYCKRFVSVKDYTWCRQAMPKVSSNGVQKAYLESEYVLPVTRGEKNSDVDPDSLLALSFGVSNPDIWSEVMSNKFSLKTKLFDCNYQLPMDLHANHSKENRCMVKKCYNTEYEVENICLDDSSGRREQFKVNGKTRQPLSVALQGRKPLSTFVKLDVEGAEWKTLQWLAEHDDEINKIRTLDVKFYLAKDLGKNGSSKESMTHHVDVMGSLLQKFAVVGSTVEGDVELKRVMFEDSIPQHYKEPLIHTQGGLSLEECTVSYMNRQLL